MTCFFFSSFKTLLTSKEGTSPVEFNVLTYFLLAGFEVTTIGRFWVTAEALGNLAEMMPAEAQIPNRLALPNVKLMLRRSGVGQYLRL
jgi:hypothetical protein